VADKVTFDFDIAAVQAALNQYARQERVSAALAALGRILVNRIRLGFRASTDPYGLPWLAPILRKGQPLLDTGRLRASISSQVQGKEVVVGTNLIYAPIHQFGGVIVAKKAKYLAIPVGGSAAGEKPTGWISKKSVYIPRRRFMPLNDAGQVELPPAWAQSALAAMSKELKL
jgi:phage gpG-like protein